MKGTKEDVARRLYETSDSIRKIADKILAGKYNPKDWIELSERFAPVVVCLEEQAVDFMP